MSHNKNWCIDPYRSWYISEKFPKFISFSQKATFKKCTFFDCIPKDFSRFTECTFHGRHTNASKPFMWCTFINCTFKHGLFFMYCTFDGCNFEEECGLNNCTIRNCSFTTQAIDYGSQRCIVEDSFAWMTDSQLKAIANTLMEKDDNWSDELVFILVAFTAYSSKYIFQWRYDRHY